MFITFTHTKPISSIPITSSIPLFQSTKPNSLQSLNSNRKPSKGFKLSFSENKQELPEKQNGNNEKKEEEEEEKADERPRFNLRWTELLFDPDPNNVVAVGLTGVLAWASVQVLWQLFVISFAILIAAVNGTSQGHPSWSCCTATQARLTTEFLSSALLVASKRFI